MVRRSMPSGSMDRCWLPSGSSRDSKNNNLCSYIHIEDVMDLALGAETTHQHSPSILAEEHDFSTSHREQLPFQLTPEYLHTSGVSTMDLDAIRSRGPRPWRIHQVAAIIILSNDTIFLSCQGGVSSRPDFNIDIEVPKTRYEAYT
ncbi:hypothetical protein INT45_010224 [Circinella minor]|uniref:Uncharacterized protein n=1 Tax=Circinella minor TaxID=1195481 RepID=A0A8H7SCD9_9FUNG|nr:hypothetical protein INT45_010224 [Circinella minor]